MSQRITVKSIVTKPTKKEGTNITTVEDEKGAKMSAFNDAALEKIHAGDVIEVDVELKGTYANITAWKLIESKPAPSAPILPAAQVTTKEDWAEKDRITRASIERQVALKSAVEARPSGETQVIVATAEAFYRFLSGVTAKPPLKGEALKDALFPPDKQTGTPEPSKPASEPAGTLSGAPQAHEDDVVILVGDLLLKFGWKEKVTAEKYIVQNAGHGAPWTQEELQKVRKAAKL